MFDLHVGQLVVQLLTVASATALLFEGGCHSPSFRLFPCLVVFPCSSPCHRPVISMPSLSMVAVPYTFHYPSDAIWWIKKIDAEEWFPGFAVYAFLSML